MADPHAPTQIHTHTFRSDAPHAATYVPVRTIKEDLLAAWVDNGVIAELKPASLKLLLYLLRIGQPMHGGWVSATYTSDADVRAHLRLGKRAPYGAIQDLLRLKILRSVDQLPGRYYRLVPSPDWHTQTDDQQLALDFGGPPGVGEAAEDQDDPRQGEGRRASFDPRWRADDPRASADFPAQLDPNPRWRADEDPRASADDPRASADLPRASPQNPRWRAEDPRASADDPRASADARVSSSSSREEEEKKAAAAFHAPDPRASAGAARELRAAIVEAAIGEPLASRLLHEPGMTAADLRTETQRCQQRGKGPAIIAANAIARAKARVAQRERRLAAREQLHADHGAIDRAIESLSETELAAWVERVYERNPHLRRQARGARDGQVRALIFQAMQFRAGDASGAGLERTPSQVITDAAGRQAMENPPARQ